MNCNPLDYLQGPNELFLGHWGNSDNSCSSPLCQVLGWLVDAVDVPCLWPPCRAASVISADRLQEASSTFFSKDFCCFCDQDFEISLREEIASAKRRSNSLTKCSFNVLFMGSGQLSNMIDKSWQRLVFNQLSAWRRGQWTCWHWYKTFQGDLQA